MKPNARVLLGTLVGCSVLAGCTESTLFDAPERGGAASPPVASADGSLLLVTALPYRDLAKIADGIPQSTPIGGKGQSCLSVPQVVATSGASGEECYRRPYLDYRGFGIEKVCTQPEPATTVGAAKQCADYQWTAEIRKDGAPKLSRAGTALKLVQPVQVAGQTDVSGDLAKVLPLKGKAIDVKAQPGLGLTATLDKAWCPVVSAASGSWLEETSVEIIAKSCTGLELPQGQQELCAGPVNLPVSKEINAAFDKHREALLKAAQAASTCDGVKSGIAAQWRPLAIRIERDQSPPLYLNVEPRSASIAAITAEDDRLRVAVRMNTQTSISPDPSETAVRPLPALDPAKPEAGALQVNLPARIGYQQLSQQLMQRLGDKAFQMEVSGGTMGMRVTEAQIYPSRGGLVLGVKIDAKLPGGWFNKTGWVYLTGKPNAAKDGQTIKVENFQFAPLVDTAFWSTAEPLLKTEFLTAVGDAASFDLGKGIETSMNEVTQGIAKAAVPGLRIRAGAATSNIDGIHVADSAVIAMVKMALPVEAEITPTSEK